MQLDNYQGLYNLTSEELEDLNSHNDSCKKSTSEVLTDTLVLSYNNIKESLKASVATDNLLRDDNLNTNDLFWDISSSSKLSSSIASGVISVAIEELENNSTEDPAILTAAITEQLLRKGVLSSEQLSEFGTDYFDYVGKIIPDMQKFIKKVRSASSIKQLKKGSTAEFLLRNDTAAITEMQQHHLSPIKQIHVSGAQMTCTCPICNKEVLLDKLGIVYLIFATEKGHRAFEDTDKNTVAILPNINYCSCGEGFVYSLYDLYRINVTIKTKMKKSANKFAQEALQFGKGTACARTEIPLNFFYDSISYLFYGDPINTDAAELITGTNLQDIRKTVSVKEILGEIKVDSKEIEEAAVQFYNRLIGKGIYTIKNIQSSSEADTDDMDDCNVQEFSTIVHKSAAHLSYHELAITIATHLSKNYDVLKRQALFSLIFSLNESSLFAQLVNKQHLWDKEIELKAYAMLPNVNTDQLDAVHSTMISLLYEKYSDVQATTAEKLQYLKQREKDLQVEVESLKKNAATFYDVLKKNKDMLSYTRIINLNQYKLNEIFGVLDPELIAFFDEITDRMIINNYAEKYFPIYVNYSIFNTATLNSAINKYSDTSAVSKSLVNAFKKVASDANYMDMSLEAVLQNEFAKVAELSTKGLDSLHSLYSAFRDCDYYSFIQATAKLDSLQSKIISSTLQKGLQKLYIASEKDRQSLNTVNDIHFYLKDFSDEELDSMSMKSRATLELLKFGLYVPKRLPSENINNYIERFARLQSQGKLYTQDCYKYAELFEKYAEFYGVIFLCGSITNMEYSSYTRSSFISVLCDIAVKYVSRDFGRYLFAINEEMLSRICYDRESMYNIQLSGRNEHSFYAILNGQYNSCMADIAEKELDKYLDYTVKSVDSFSTYTKHFVLREFLQRITCKPYNELAVMEAKYQAVKQIDSQNNIDVSDVNGEDVYDQIINEIEYYADIKVDEETS